MSGAWHSELIKEAEAPFSAFLETVEFRKPAHTVVHNVSADGCNDEQAIRQLMVQQLCSPVRWYDTIHRLMSEKVDVFVEVGPGKVLTGLLKKIVPQDYVHSVFSVSNMKTLDSLVAGIA